MYVEAPPPTSGLFGLDAAKDERVVKALASPLDPRSRRDDTSTGTSFATSNPPDGLSSRGMVVGESRSSSGCRPCDVCRSAPRMATPSLTASPTRCCAAFITSISTARGEVAMDEVVTSEQQARQRFLVNSLMEEAIRSSQLEGATTSRRVAKELLRTGREPRDRSERMIVNNYRALQFMREEMGDELESRHDSRAAPDRHRGDPRRSGSPPGACSAPSEERVARLRPRRRTSNRSTDPHPPRSSRANAPALRLRQRRATTASNSSIRSCGRSSCTSGSPTTTRSRTATVGRRGSCSSG